MVARVHLVSSLKGKFVWGEWQPSAFPWAPAGGRIVETAAFIVLNMSSAQSCGEVLFFYRILSSLQVNKLKG